MLFLNNKACILKLFFTIFVSLALCTLLFSVSTSQILCLYFFLMLFQSTSSSSHFTSVCYGESERTQGAYSRLHSQQRDSDSKRPKLSCTSTSSVRSNGLTAFSGEKLITRA